MKNLIIFFSGDYNIDFGDDAFFGMPDYFKNGFIDFINMFQNDKNIKIFICRGEDSYLGNSKFKYGFLYKKNEFTFKNEEINSDLIFNISSSFFENSFNDNRLIKFCKNKINFITLFPHLSPKTVLINSYEELKVNLKKIPKRHKKVLKPIENSNGSKVLITNSQKEILKYKEYPFLLQEFVDTSSGIPYVFEGIHTLRIFIINGEVVWSIFKAYENQSQEDLNILITSELGLELTKVIKEIDSLLEMVGDRFYSIDLGYTNNGIKVFDINSSPTIMSLEFGTREIFDGLHDIIIKKLKIKKRVEV